VAVTEPVKVARPEAVAASAPQQRQGLPAELGEKRRKVCNDQQSEGCAHWQHRQGGRASLWQLFCGNQRWRVRGCGFGAIGFHVAKELGNSHQSRGLAGHFSDNARMCLFTWELETGARFPGLFWEASPFEQSNFLRCQEKESITFRRRLIHPVLEIEGGVAVRASFQSCDSDKVSLGRRAMRIMREMKPEHAGMSEKIRPTEGATSQRFRLV
jgi:hypothetical protein